MNQPGEARPSLLVVTTLIGLLTCFSTGRAESPDTVADEFMALSGLDRHIEQLPRLYVMFVDQVFVGIERSGAKLPGKTKSLVRRHFQEALDVRAVQLEARRRLTTALHEDVVGPTMSWLRSDLGRKITELENQAASPDSSLQQAAFGLQLQMEPPPLERMLLARRLEEATGMSDYAVDEWETVIEALGIALSPDRGNQSTGAKASIRENLAKMRPDMKDLLRQTALRHILFAYRSLADEELAAYVVYLESPSGREVSRIVHEALRDIELGAMDGMEERLTDSLSNHRRKAGV